MAVNDMTKFDPPYDMKGNGTPVKGNIATIAPKLIRK